MAFTGQELLPRCEVLRADNLPWKVGIAKVSGIQVQTFRGETPVRPDGVGHSYKVERRAQKS